MTFFFLITAFGYAFLAAVAILDKFILSGALRVSSYAFYSTVFFFAAFLLLPFSDPISFNGFLWALGSGLGFGFATWTMFLGLRNHEATHLIPFIGAVTAIFVYGLSFLILGEALSVVQTAGILILVVASLLFSYEKGKGHKEMHSSFAWGILSGFLFAVSHVAAKHFYGDYSFITGLAWTKGLVGVVAIVILFSADARRHLFEKGKKNNFWIVLLNKALAVLGTLAVQYAIAIGSVAVVSGLVGLQYALIMIFASLSTILSPKFFSEYFTKKEVFVEIAAIMLVIGGITLLI